METCANQGKAEISLHFSNPLPTRDHQNQLYCTTIPFAVNTSPARNVQGHTKHPLHYEYHTYIAVASQYDN